MAHPFQNLMISINNRITHKTGQ